MKLNHIFFTLATVASFTTAQAQVKVGSNPGTINGGSALEIEASDKGLLMPRVVLTNTTAWGLSGTAVAGMSVYNTSSVVGSTNAAYPATGVGEYYWDGTGWVSKKGGLSQLGADNGLMVGYNSVGNVGLGGTLNKNTNVETDGKAMSFGGTGFVGVGTTSPKHHFTVSSDGQGGGNADDISLYSFGANVAPDVVVMTAQGTEAVPADLANSTTIGGFAMGGRWNGGWHYGFSRIHGTYMGNGTTGLTDMRFQTSSVERMRINENGNVGIGTTNPSSSAVLDITSTNKGVLFPRVSLQSLTDVTTIQNPDEGLTVWNTNASLSQGKGLFYFLNGSWSKIQRQNNTTGNVFDFVDFVQTSSSLTMTSTYQEITELSKSYTATLDGKLFLNYIIYATLANNANPKVSNVICEVRFTDLADLSVQKGSMLISPVEVNANQASNAVATPTILPVQVIKGHTYSIKIFAREAYLDTNNYTIKVGTVAYNTNSANSSLSISALLSDN